MSHQQAAQSYIANNNRKRKELMILINSIYEKLLTEQYF